MDQDFCREAVPRPEVRGRIISLDAYRRPRAKQPPPRLEFGSGSYHDAAIRAEKARPRDA